MATILETLAIKLVLDAAEFAKGMGTVETSWTQVGQRMSNAGRNMSLFVTAPLLGIGAAALKTAAEFETNMNQLQVVSKATGDEMKLLTDQALDLGKKTSFSAGEAAASMLELGKAGLNVSQVSGAIPGVLDLAAAGGLDLANAAEIAANAINVFGMDASAATTVANMFAAAANASSVEVVDIADSFKMAGSVWAMAKQDADNLTTAIALMGNAGMKGSDAGTSLKQMMLALTAPTAKASTLLSDLQISVFNADGSMRDFRDILLDMEAALGANGSKLVTVGGVTEDLSKAMSKAQESIGPVTDKVREQEMELGILQNELAATVAKYGEGSTQADRKRLAIEKLTNKLDENRDELSSLQATIDAYNAAVSSGKTVTEAMTDASKAYAMATIFGSDAVRAASILVAEGTAGYDAMMASVTEAGAAQEMATAKTKGLAGAFEYFKGTIDTLMIQTASPWLDQLSQMIRGAADLIAKFGDLPAPVQRAVVIFGALLAAVGPVLVMVGSLISAVGTISAALAGLGPIVAGAGAVLATLTGPIALVLAAVTGLAIAWNQNWFGIQDVVKAGVQYIKDLFNNFDWGSLGSNLVNSITTGISNGWAKITEAAANIAQGALDAAKRALGIASPSKPGLAYGYNFGTSIGMGATKALGEIKANIYDQLDRMVGGLDGQINVNAAGAGGMTIEISNIFHGSVDAATVEAASRDGVLAALRQAGYA